METGEERQNFYWDFGVAAMEDKDRMPRYYLQDGLGSPLRVLYGNGNGDIYGYDEFGEELYEAPDPEKEASNRYSRQGEGQPFGYTGYRYDAVGGTYFAQAREYKAEFGRFLSKDLFKGYIILTKTFNRYLYCINNPLLFVDRDGNILESVQNLANESLNDLTNNTDITMKEYILRISWSDKTIINPNGEKFGWLSDMKNINVEDQITNLSQNLNLGMYDFWWERNTKLTAKETLEWFQMMQNAMNTYQDYYWCSD